MNTDIRVSNAALDLYLRTGLYRESELRVNAVHLWRGGTHEYVRNRVLSRIATLQMRHSVVRVL